MKKIAIIYGSSTDNTKDAAQMIAVELSEFNPEVRDVSTISPDELEVYDHLFFGTSTWGFGDLQDDWEGFLPKLTAVDFSGKTISLFGLGDPDSYPDTFVDGMGLIYEFLQGKGCQIIGSVSSEGYSFDDSRAFVDGKFVGLPLNADSESDMTEERIKNWINSMKSSL